MLDGNGIRICTSDAESRIVGPQSLKKHMLYVNYYSLLAKQLGDRKLCYKIRCHTDWPALGSGGYKTVRNCLHCARKRIKLRRNVAKLQLFLAKTPLTSVYIGIFGEAVCTQVWIKHLVVITYHFTEMTKTVPMKDIKTGEIEKRSVTSCVFSYGPLEELIADNGG